MRAGWLWSVLIGAVACTDDRPPVAGWAERVAFAVQDQAAFLLPAGDPGPWVWYAPVITDRTPNDRQSWLFDAVRAEGIAVAGIDVGESYGSPAGQRLFSAFHQAMIARGYDPAPILLAQSRGGLQHYAWAVRHPDAVKCIAGIYPVVDVTRWPPDRSLVAEAYGVPPDTFAAQAEALNPITHLDRLRVPILHLHGEADTVVPLAPHSGAVAAKVPTARVIVIPGRGHEETAEFFEAQALRDFIHGCT